MVFKLKPLPEEVKQTKALLKLNKHMSYSQAENIVLNRLNKQKRIKEFGGKEDGRNEKLCKNKLQEK